MIKTKNYIDACNFIVKNLEVLLVENNMSVVRDFFILCEPEIYNKILKDKETIKQRNVQFRKKILRLRDNMTGIAWEKIKEYECFFIKNGLNHEC